MKKERFSNLQKWIIIECFKVTVLLDRSDLKELNGLSNRCKYCRNKDNITKKRSIQNKILYYCNNGQHHTEYYYFYREDVLLSYFKLEPDNFRDTFRKKQYFKGSKDNNKAYVSLGRSIKNLTDTDYLYSFDDYDGIRIDLTDKGKEKAMELLDLDRLQIDEPPLLTAKEMEIETATAWKEFNNL